MAVLDGLGGPSYRTSECGRVRYRHRNPMRERGKDLAPRLRFGLVSAWIGRGIESSSDPHLNTTHARTTEPTITVRSKIVITTARDVVA